MPKFNFVPAAVDADLHSSSSAFFHSPAVQGQPVGLCVEIVGPDQETVGYAFRQMEATNMKCIRAEEAGDLEATTCNPQTVAFVENLLQANRYVWVTAEASATEASV